MNFRFDVKNAETHILLLSRALELVLLLLIGGGRIVSAKPVKLVAAADFCYGARASGRGPDLAPSGQNPQDKLQRASIETGARARTTHRLGLST